MIKEQSTNYIIRRPYGRHTFPEGAVFKESINKICYSCGGVGYYMRKARIVTCVLCQGLGMIQYIYFYKKGE